MNKPLTAATITDADIRDLRITFDNAGDWRNARMCKRALWGAGGKTPDFTARALCAEVINAHRAQRTAGMSRG